MRPLGLGLGGELIQMCIVASSHHVVVLPGEVQSSKMATIAAHAAEQLGVPARPTVRLLASLRVDATRAAAQTSHVLG
jgi:hypothetical protein